MKLFLQITITLIVIFGLFFLLGYVVKEQTNVNEVVVNAPVEFCWDVYQDESRISDWMEGVKSITLTEGLAGRVGAKQKIVMSSSEGSSLSASASELSRTITKVSAPNNFSFDYTNSIIDGRSDITFITNDSTTIIKSVDKFSGKELWMRSTMFLMKSSINSKTQAQFDRLKLIIENDYKAQLKKQTETQIDTIKTGMELD